MRAVIFVKRSVRFPGKHSILVNGLGLTQGIARKLSGSGLFDETIIFSKDQNFKSAYGRIVADGSEGTILDSVIRAVQEFGDIFAFAGDMPFICLHMVSAMLLRFDGKTLCPRSTNNVLQTLHCIYAVRDLTDLKAYASNGGKSMHGFIERSGDMMNYEPKDEICFENINFPSDLVRLNL
ncbi:MAG: molybdenum cofactor guanylyltransferase [Thermoplasmataceae archaeon]